MCAFITVYMVVATGTGPGDQCHWQKTNEGGGVAPVMSDEVIDVQINTILILRVNKLMLELGPLEGCWGQGSFTEDGGPGIRDSGDC